MLRTTLWGRCLLAILTVIFLGFAAQTSVLGQGPAEKMEAGEKGANGVDKPNEPSTAFKASNEAPKENLPGWPFLYGAYSLIWLLLFGYVVFLWKKHLAIEAQLARVNKRMDDFDGALEALEKK
jgi:CcmD family protein